MATAVMPPQPPPSHVESSDVAKDKPIPKRLAQAFDALCVDDTVDTTASDRSEDEDKGIVQVSPTAVAALDADAASQSSATFLHPQLRRDLSEALVNRVSFYAIIHDINKEATALAQQDPLPQPQAETTTEAGDPLVQAATHGMNHPQQPATTPAKTTNTASTATQEKSARIDEEEWLLQTIQQQREPTPAAECPPTFLQAMGEQEYDILSHKSRTQLWKPSRSWWEAKSGKNPWIEPASHNKRWRYLWPLIHYHKFLAKCVKKLKRNNVDVKVAVTPVAVFLREEVCAVSDHLAAVSLFGSEEWMNCLANFDGWTDTSVESEAELRNQVSSLKLRALGEPSDVDSPLLRSQIDDHFLRAMANARTEATEASTTHAPSAAPTSRKPIGIPRPPGTPSSSVPKQVAGVRRNRYNPQHQQQQQQQPYPHHPSHWYGWEQQQYDNSSVHSGISMDSYNYHPPHDYSNNMQPQHPYMAAAAAAAPYYYPSDGSYGSGYDDSAYGWVDPNVYAMQQQQPPQQYTPRKDASDDEVPSPYWSHLDQATAHVMATPQTPPRKPPQGNDDANKNNSTAAAAQPLLLKHYYYYEAAPVYSPATQFLMTPPSDKTKPPSS